MDVVDRIVFVVDAQGAGDVVVDEDLTGVVGDLVGHRGHFAEETLDLLGQGLARVTAAGGVGDVDRQGAHAGHVLDDVDAGDDLAQIAGHGGLAGEQLEGPVLRGDPEFVELVERAEDRLGGLEVGIEKRLASGAVHAMDVVAHDDQSVGEVVHLFAVNGAHGHQ